MSEIDYLPAFPTTERAGSINAGLLMRQYAAIHLRVPDSGDPELDRMIRESLRIDFAAKAMQSLITVQFQAQVPQAAETAFEWAAAMVAKREKNA